MSRPSTSSSANGKKDVDARHKAGHDEQLAFALPDQDQTESGKRRAVPGPLDLVDHEARWRPGDRAGALTDPEQAYGERKKADGQKQFAHGLSSRALAAAVAQAMARVALSFTQGKSRA